MQQHPPTGEGGPDQPADSRLPQYVSHGDAARRLGIAPKTLRAWARGGLHGCPTMFDLGATKGVFRLDEILRWIESRRVIQQATTVGGADARRDDAARATDVA